MLGKVWENLLTELVCEKGKKCIFFKKEENMYYKRPFSRNTKVLHQGDTIYYCSRREHILGYPEIIHKLIIECKHKQTNRLIETVE